jgi:hypothetical protein
VLWKTLVALPDATENVTERQIARHAVTPAPTGLLHAVSDFVAQLASAAHQLLSG